MARVEAIYNLPSLALMALTFFEYEEEEMIKTQLPNHDLGKP
jgi:hypothetical protein